MLCDKSTWINPQFTWQQLLEAQKVNFVPIIHLALESSRQVFLLPTACCGWDSPGDEMLCDHLGSESTLGDSQTVARLLWPEKQRKQHNSTKTTRLSRTYFILCILPCIGIAQLDVLLLSFRLRWCELRIWVFSANKYNWCHFLWFLVCSIWRGFQLSLVWELRVRILRGVTKQMQQLTLT